MKKIISIIICLLAVFVARAQVSIQVQAPNMVEVGEQFNVTFILEGSGSLPDVEWSAGDDFQLVWGPQKGSSTSVNIVNGKMTKTVQSTYTYVLLSRKAGTFYLPPVSVSVKGQQVTSKSACIEVVSGGQSSSQASSAQGGSSEASTPVRGSSDIFMRMLLSKRSAMVGEGITATLKIYSRTNLQGVEDVKFPTFTGFWAKELAAPTNLDFRRENVGDVLYDAAVLRSWEIVPQQSGEVIIEPAEIVCLVAVRNPSSGNSIFDSFFDDGYQTVRKRISTPEIKINVKSLPAGAPASFCGGVGSYTMTASLACDSLKAHDASSLKIKVTGKGNKQLLETPKVKFPADFDAYDIKTTEEGDSKVFEYPFIPRSGGDFEIGPLEYSYYDIKKGKYVTLKSDVMKLHVAKGDNSASYGNQSFAAPTSNRKDVKDLGSDIRYIKVEAPSSFGKSSFFAGTPLFYILSALILIGGAAVFFAMRKMRDMKADVAGTRSRAATKMARKRLVVAGQYLTDNKYTEFYDELHKALMAFVSYKLNMDMSDMSKENIEKRLLECGVDEENATGLTGLLDTCEQARYSPSAGSEGMSQDYEKAVNVITAIDSMMKSKSGKFKTLALTAVLLLSAFGASAQTACPDSLWQAGVDAYSAGDWQTAAIKWSELMDNGTENAELYYNLGNAFFKQGETACAILNYERALKLDPSFTDARFNLEFVNQGIRDKVEAVPEFFLRTWMRNLGYLMSSNAWTVLFFVFFAAFVAALLLFALSGSQALRKTGFFSSIALLLLAVLAVSFAFSQRKDYMSNESAVIMSPVVSVKSAPGDDSVELFVIHEGLKVKVTDELSTWSSIEIPDGRKGWIKSAEKENI